MIIRDLTYVIRLLVIGLVGCVLPKSKKYTFLTKGLASLGPSFIKLGQSLAVRPDIVGDEMSQALGLLHDRLPPFRRSVAKRILQKELGRDVEICFRVFDEQPVAAASIAQVHKAQLMTGEWVAVKILRPNIEKRFKRDLALLHRLARFIGIFPKYRRLRLTDVVDLLADSVKKELDLRMEAAAASAFYTQHEHDNDIVIPKVFWSFTSRRVLCVEWVDGVPINDIDQLKSQGHDLPKLSHQLAVFFFNQTYQHGFFHADLHPGNLFVDEKGRIVVVDFGIMGRLDEDTRIFVALILKGFLDGDYDQVAKVHFDAGYVPKDQSMEDFSLACRAIGEPILGLPAQHISIAKLLALLFKITEDFNMQTQPQLLLFQKTMVLIEGLGLRLNPDVNMWQQAEPWIASWAKDNLSFDAIAKRKLKVLQQQIMSLPERFERLEQVWLEPTSPSCSKTSCVWGGVVLMVVGLTLWIWR